MNEQRRRVDVMPYRAEWPEMFARDAEQLASLFGAEAVRVHHIGSTSVPGLSAKPILDFLIEVRDLEQADRFNPQMVALGIEPKGENGIPGRRYFQKGGNNRTHHIHLFQVGNPEIDRHLVFRDYLRAHPEQAKRYGGLKEQLAAQFPCDIESYIAGKHDLILELEDAALRWSGTAR